MLNGVVMAVICSKSMHKESTVRASCVFFFKSPKGLAFCTSRTSCPFPSQRWPLSPLLSQVIDVIGVSKVASASRISRISMVKHGKPAFHNSDMSICVQLLAQTWSHPLTPCRACCLRSALCKAWIAALWRLSETKHVHASGVYKKC